MADDITIKETKAPNGKVKYQAQVWFEGKYIASKKFDSRAVAVEYKKRKLKEAAAGTLKPAKERKAQRATEAVLDRPMGGWATLYIEAHGKEHGKNRIAEYDLVGRLLKGKTLHDFSGKAGGELIAKLAADWRHLRLPRSKHPDAVCASDEPVADQTLRLRLSALDRLIEFAMSKVPESVDFRGPTKPFGYKPPPAHSNKRTRLPSDDEYAALLKHFGANSDMSHFLRVVDDTGCRLSEVSSARGADVVFFGAAGHVLGGTLTLRKHKTASKVGARIVPLSRHVAEVLYARKGTYDDGPLFPALADANGVCKTFDDARTRLAFEDLVIKDFRRAFINRNVRSVSAVELMHIVGKSSLIDTKALSAGENNVLRAVGHTNISTTFGYVTPDQQGLAQVFTQTSRWLRIARLIESEARPVDARSEDAAALEKEMANLLARMARLGLIEATG
ncbi:MAG: hypothetical protein H0W40_16035 [Methylibium sp.]|uniref:hypothetical protein n=1 Tax=Methylibium sp. TaxID=2067992 RepID=UPI001850593A|nr:hypothetical protein [Methylibium sp.]MBA3598866.1 hypothetical protein [Methylibium sp.]